MAKALALVGQARRVTHASSPQIAYLDHEDASILSPLRYPGSKRRLASFIAHTLELNDLEPPLFVEPFAGGSSVALQLFHDAPGI
jgi:D12 class N6 adenine-specific DNA methyltransferase